MFLCVKQAMKKGPRHQMRAPVTAHSAEPRGLFILRGENEYKGTIGVC